jgi:hypothetical protein
MFDKSFVQEEALGKLKLDADAKLGPNRRPYLQASRALNRA